MKFDLIVRGGRVIDPAQGIDGVHDVAVRDGAIAQVAPRIAGTAARTVNARNQLVIPGMIDTHSHISYDVAPIKLPAPVDRFGSFTAYKWKEYGFRRIGFWTQGFSPMK